jgi:hypothetical protein
MPLSPPHPSSVFDPTGSGAGILVRLIAMAIKYIVM